MNDVTSLQLIISRKNENEYIEIDLNEYNEKYKRLQQRIDKAVEYLKLFDENSNLIDHSVIKGALNILKGNDSNEGK